MNEYFEEPIHDWIIFGTDWCGYCKKAKKYLKKQGEEFHFVNLDEDDPSGSLREELKEWSGMNTIPIILYNQELVGGYDDLIK